MVKKLTQVGELSGLGGGNGYYWTPRSQGRSSCHTNSKASTDRRKFPASYVFAAAAVPSRFQLSVPFIH